MWLRLKTSCTTDVQRVPVLEAHVSRCAVRRNNVFARPSLVRIRLTLWYVGIFALVLAAFIGTAPALHYLHLTDRFYQSPFGLWSLIMPIALLSAGFAGSRVTGKVLDHLEQMAQFTEHITADRLNERIPVGNPGDELGHMASALNGLLERLEVSFRQSQQFTSEVSHELRTPLAALRSIGEAGLLSEHDAGKYRDTIGSMLEEVARLTEMVDTLLTVARAESGAIKLTRSTFSLMDMVQECVAIVRILAEDKMQTLTVDGNGEVDVYADRSFLRMAFVNLLDNAVKYSPSGSAIHVRVRPADMDPDGGRSVEFTVEDQGPGIPEGARERVFNRFFRLDDARDRHAGGVGLGLAIAKWTVEAHHGRITVNPAPGGGSLFCVKIPICA